MPIELQLTCSRAAAGEPGDLVFAVQMRMRPESGVDQTEHAFQGDRFADARAADDDQAIRRRRWIQIDAVEHRLSPKRLLC